MAALVPWTPRGSCQFYDLRRDFLIVNLYSRCHRVFISFGTDCQPTISLTSEMQSSYVIHNLSATYYCRAQGSFCRRSWLTCGAVTALDWLPLLPLLLLLLAYTIRYRRFATGSTVVRCKIDIEFFGLAVPPDYRSSCTAIGIKRAPPVANRALSSTSSSAHLLHLYRWHSLDKSLMWVLITQERSTIARRYATWREYCESLSIRSHQRCY